MSIERGRRRAGRGFTLIELIVFIIIVGVALVGILSVLNITVFHSADPMIRKQMLAIAESLLEEVEMQAFTYCDPTDANVATATGTAGCATTVEALGPEAGETRGSSTTPFNNVNDYSGIAPLNPVTDINGNHSYDGYSATITLTAEPLNGISSNSSAAGMNVLRITVTVSHGSDSLTLEGYRTRNSPNLP